MSSIIENNQNITNEMTFTLSPSKHANTGIYEFKFNEYAYDWKDVNLFYNNHKTFNIF